MAARELGDLVLAHFRAEDGGFYDTADDAEPLVARPRSLQDAAVPAGGAAACIVLLRLAALTGDGRYRAAAEAALAPMEGIAVGAPHGVRGVAARLAAGKCAHRRGRHRRRTTGR